MHTAVGGSAASCMGRVQACMLNGVHQPDADVLERKVLCLWMQGLVTGNIDEMLSAHVGAVFMPHGLGHLLVRPF